MPNGEEQNEDLDQLTLEFLEDSPFVEAAFESVCDWCDEEINQGDLIAKFDLAWVHANSGPLPGDESCYEESSGLG